MAEKINFKSFVLSSDRMIDKDEGKFLDEVMALLERYNYSWFRPRDGENKLYTTERLYKDKVLPGSRETSFRHTSLYQMSRCTTLIVSDSQMGSQGSNGYLRVATCQVVLPGANTKVVRRLTDWLLLRVATKATRVILVAGTNDWLKVKNPIGTGASSQR